ncbi:MAG: tRNA lysidine(34) synthetase TilS [Bacteroidaceae bacterium]|nr:tRNA lysidine(34) synthetase TilS [Bacteroidaceae bacterium]
MNGFISSVRKFISSNSLFSKERLQIIALSGGADSVALLRTMLHEGYSCLAVHCNFHLRGEESMRDEKFVRNLCATLSVPLHVEDFETEEYARAHGISIEMAARELRYSLFERLRQENNAERIAVAHHRDDSVETMLLNLIRGTGIRGLGGIRPLNGNIARPLLGVSRADIESYLEELGQDFVTDSTNLLTEYRRNRIRHNVIPLLKEINPSVEKSLIQTAENLRQAYTLYNIAVTQAKHRILTEDQGILAIDTAALFNEPAHETIAFEILSPFGFNDQQIHDMLDASKGTPGKQFLSATHILTVDRNRLLAREIRKPFDPVCITVQSACTPQTVTLTDGRSLEFSLHPSGTEIKRDSSIAMLDADLTGNTLVIRQVQPGDSFMPFGMKGQQTLSDYMTDRKYSLFQKQDQIVICNSSGIVWVAGQRIDDRYRLTSATRTILQIRFL